MNINFKVQFPSERRNYLSLNGKQAKSGVQNADNETKEISAGQEQSLLDRITMNTIKGLASVRKNQFAKQTPEPQMQNNEEAGGTDTILQSPADEPDDIMFEQNTADDASEKETQNLNNDTISGDELDTARTGNDILNQEDETDIVTTVLKNGTIKTDRIHKNSIAGTTVYTEFDKPVNGVKSMKVYRFTNGDLSSIETRDENDNVIKSISLSYRYIYCDKPLKMRIYERDKGNTVVYYNYNSSFNKLKSVTISRPDGTKSTVKIKKSNNKTQKMPNSFAAVF